VAASRRRSAPPAPPPYADRPTAGGLVVPWITARVGDRPYFGSNDPFRIQRALVERLCQICGTPLGRRIHLLVRPADVEAGWTAEPGLHPECRALSVRSARGSPGRSLGRLVDHTLRIPAALGPRPP
jgi:hypothetical protein